MWTTRTGSEEPLDLLPQYDELWAVSDIHLGGARSADWNFQIFRMGDRLAKLIDRIRTERPHGEVALVLNGDVIDSLAEYGVRCYIALEVETALAMMERIYKDDSFAPVWDALTAFVRTPRRHLVFVVGNHDIELALTPVQASLRLRLAGDSTSAAARIVFATHGGGFACRVGRRRVFCTHGNEVDPWNRVDHGELGMLDNAMNAGRRPDASVWQPNAGTRLVVDIMNEVKRDYPFVDLLKPEIKPVLGVLLTLAPEMVKRVDLSAAYAVVRDRIRGRSEVRNLLSAETPLESLSPNLLAASALNELMGEGLASQVRGTPAPDLEDELLLWAGRAIAPGAPAAQVGDGDGPATLGWSDVVAGWLGRVDRVEALRRALGDWLAGDDTFDVGKRDDTYDDIAARVGPGVDFVVTGHTHLARSLPLPSGGHYFNCGTWIRLLRFTPEVLRDRHAFEQVLGVLKRGSMEALDAAKIPGSGPQLEPLVLDRAHAVWIRREGESVTGELLRVTDAGAGPGLHLEPETSGATR